MCLFVFGVKEERKRLVSISKNVKKGKELKNKSKQKRRRRKRSSQNTYIARVTDAREEEGEEEEEQLESRGTKWIGRFELIKQFVGFVWQTNFKINYIWLRLIDWLIK